VLALISSAEEDGGKIILDGRNITPPEIYPNGNFVGPTIIQGDTSMRCYQYVFENLHMKSG
jgi:malonate-semialdehyde dehydrogenase (acetylating) / methylmalonate-semialdehyde dehydrogenase